MVAAAARKQGLARRAPSQQRGEDTVVAVRKAATKLLASRDFARISVTELARKAGVGVGTFYHFYPTKEALLLDLREQLFAETTATLAKSFDTPVHDGKSLMVMLEKLIKQWIAMSVR